MTVVFPRTKASSVRSLPLVNGHRCQAYSTVSTPVVPRHTIKTVAHGLGRGGCHPEPAVVVAVVWIIGGGVGAGS
jgi:hypothetical protein